SRRGTGTKNGGPLPPKECAPAVGGQLPSGSVAQTNACRITTTQHIVQGEDGLRGATEVRERATDRRITVEQVGDVGEDFQLTTAELLYRPGRVDVGVVRRFHRVVVDLHTFRDIGAVQTVAV